MILTIMSWWRMCRLRSASVPDIILPNVTACISPCRPKAMNQLRWGHTKPRISYPDLRNSRLKRKPNRNNPAVVVLMKLCHLDLHTGAKAQVQPLSDGKSTQDNPGHQKHFLLSVQNAARPKRGILLEHRPKQSVAGLPALRPLCASTRAPSRFDSIPRMRSIHFGCRLHSRSRLRLN